MDVKNTSRKFEKICIFWFICHSLVFYYSAHVAHHTNSLAIKAFTHLILFDVLRVLTYLIASWCKIQKPNLNFPYGYDRFEILSVFVSVVLAQIAAFFSFKDCFETFITMSDNNNNFHSHSSQIDLRFYHFKNVLLAGFLAQLCVTYGLKFVNNNRATSYDKAIALSGTNALQLQIIDIMQNSCQYLPKFLRNYISPHVFLYRSHQLNHDYEFANLNGQANVKHWGKSNPVFNINDPFNLLNSLSALLIYVGLGFFYNQTDPDSSMSDKQTNLIQTNNITVDVICCVIILFSTFVTMYPIARTMGKILLQTVSPQYTVGQLERCIQEACTLDGVLEICHEHFWILSFGQTVGSLKVRCHPDANEQLVAAHVTDKLAPLISNLTIQIVKD